MIDEEKDDMILGNKKLLKSKIIENKININNIDDNNQKTKIKEINEFNKIINIKTIEENEKIKIGNYDNLNSINEKTINNEINKNSEEKFENLDFIIKNNILKKSLINKKIKGLLSYNFIKDNYGNNLNINTKSYQKKKLIKTKLNNELNEIQNKNKEKKKLEINMNIKNPLTSKINDKLVKNKNFFSRQEEYIKKIEEKKNKIELELKKKENEEMKKTIRKNDKDNFEKFLLEMKEKEDRKNEKIERLKQLNEEKIQKEIDEINYNSINNYHLSNYELNESINWLYKEDVKQRKRNKEIMNEIFKPNFTPQINQNNFKFDKNKIKNGNTLKKKELINNFFNTLINKNNKQEINDEFIYDYNEERINNDLKDKNNINYLQNELEIIEEEDEN